MEKLEPSIFNPSVLSLMAEMVLDEAIYKFSKNRLNEQMDIALDNKDFTLAKEISNKLKQLNKKYEHIKVK